MTFLETPMLHWPDSMVSYLQQEKLLFSQDGFGMHLASYERFDDELDPGLLEYEGGRYYANILLPLSNFVTRTLQRIDELGLEFDIIAPDHGPIWRRDVGKIVDLYGRWARQQRNNNKAIVVYDTMWKSTELMGRAIGEGLHAGGASPRLTPLSVNHRSDIASELLDATALIVGAPTINNEMFPTMADLLTYVKGLRPKNLVGAVFGSYGWGGQATKQIAAIMQEMKVDLVGDPLSVKYVPDDDDLQRCYDLGMSVAGKLKNKCT